MTQILEFILGGAWQYLAAAVAGLVALLVARRSGVNAEKRKAAERSLEAIRTQKEVENYVEGRTLDDVRHELTRWMRDDE